MSVNPKKRRLIITKPTFDIKKAEKEREKKDRDKALECLAAFYGKNKISTKDSSTQTKSYPLLNTIPPYTLTILANLTRTLNLRSIFHNIPIQKIEFKRKQAKKVKIDIVGPPGSILSARFIQNGQKLTRGVKRGGHFLHCITFDISIGDKNTNLKLFTKRVQITGCKRLDQAGETINWIIKHINRLEKKGIDVYSEEEEEEDKTEGEKNETSEPETNKVLPKPIEFYNLDITMQNYHFDLGMKIKRMELTELIDGYKEFVPTYEPGIDNGVSIKRLVDEDTPDVSKNTSTKKKKRKPPSVSITTFQSGKVILSGRKYEQIISAYNDYRDFISQNEDEIRETVG